MRGERNFPKGGANVLSNEAQEAGATNVKVTSSFCLFPSLLLRARKKAEGMDVSFSWYVRHLIKEDLEAGKNE